MADPHPWIIRGSGVHDTTTAAQFSHNSGAINILFNPSNTAHEEVPGAFEAGSSSFGTNIPMANNFEQMQLYINMMNYDSQPSYTGLLMDQIRNSQEQAFDDTTEDIAGPHSTYTQMLMGNDIMEYGATEVCKAKGMIGAETPNLCSDWGCYDDEMHNSITTGGELNSASTSSARGRNQTMRGYGYDDNGDMSASSMLHTSLSTADEHSNGGEYETDEQNWQLDLFSRMRIEEDQEYASGHQPELSTRTASPNPNDNDMHTEFDNNVDGSQELTEEEIEAFIKNEQLAASEGNNADINSIYTPQIDMEFKTRHDAHHFFSFYAYLAGFLVTVTHVHRTTSRKRNNEVYKVEMKCHRHGKEPKKKTEHELEAEVMEQSGVEKGPKRNTTIQIRTDCPVVMVVKETNGIWKILRLDLDHNHDLTPGNRDQLFSGHKYMNDMEKGLIRTLNATNIPTRKMIAILSYLRGGITALPYKKKDVSNYRTKINREVTGSDMTQVMELLKARKSENPGFFYKIELDTDKRVKNLFWRDVCSLKYYAQYGDCVSFDTTYMTNRYNLPFAPFVGVTGHAHTCLFGCAFMSDETTETFNWVFNTFLESMGGKPPKTIITDQDKAMRSAIQQIFPHTIHRNCFFHIKSKCYNKNLRCFAKNEGLPEDFEDILNNSITEEEFEDLWKRMVIKYKLENNKYFSKMWEKRKRFVPVYFKHNFFPFLQSTGRSEGTNARFKDNVGPTYSVISFIKEYQRILDTINVAEDIEDTHNMEKKPKELLFGYDIEHQASELYNRNIFRKFQLQLQKTPKLSYKETEPGKCFEVWQKTNQIHKVHRVRKYVVLVDMTKGNEEFTCMCAKFCKDGILCSHILKVMIEEELSEIPDKYIIDRWRKKERKMNVPARHDTENTGTDAILRYNLLSRQSAVLNSKAAKREDAMEYLSTEFTRINSELDALLASDIAVPVNDDGIETNNEDESQVQDPTRKKQKGRPSMPKRMKPLIEQIREKMAAEQKKKNNKTTKPNKSTVHDAEGEKSKNKKTRETETTSPSGKMKKKIRRGIGGGSGDMF